MNSCFLVEADLIDSGILNEDELDKAIENLKTKVDEITNDLKEVRVLVVLFTGWPKILDQT